jgi:sortase (surface protein transpeptidase)
VTFARIVAAVAAVVVAAAATVLIVTQVREFTTSATIPPTTPPTTESTTDSPLPTTEGDPLRVTIPAIGVDARLVPVGLKPDGSMRTPAFGLAAWYQPGPLPGEPGPAVLVAHVDSKANGPDVFYRLRELAPGDQITVHYRDATTTFAVTGKEQAAKTALPTERIWTGTTTPVLRLITCGGAFDRSARSYLDNVIVYADRHV